MNSPSSPSPKKGNVGRLSLATRFPREGSFFPDGWRDADTWTKDERDVGCGLSLDAGSSFGAAGGVPRGPRWPRYLPPGRGDSSHPRGHTRPVRSHVCAPHGLTCAPAPGAQPAGTRVLWERARHCPGRAGPPHPGSSGSEHPPARAPRELPCRASCHLYPLPRRPLSPQPGRARVSRRKGAAQRALTEHSAAAAAAAAHASPPCRARGCT